MPVIPSRYSPPFYLFNGHLQTIVPSVFFHQKGNPYTRERINTRDDDFLDIDWMKRGNNKLMIVSHGLEGSSHSPYVLRFAEEISSKGWDALCWNYRGCSGEMNRKPTFYHSGFTQDLDEVIKYVVSLRQYKEIILIGFSIGANITLKYLGEQGSEILPGIKKAVVFSVPSDLESGAKQLARPSTHIYMKRFLDSFEKKFTEKEKLFPGSIDLSGFRQIKNFYEFDTRYTAPMFGFKDVHDYYSKASSKPFIPKIQIPTLIVNAINDPFLGKECFPVEEAKGNPLVFLEMPESGGHVGFPVIRYGYWPAMRALEFIA
jgi:predicted alpha/beta-fold hydrolase